MKKHILILGAGFGGMELSTMLSEAFADGIEVTLIDKNDSFYFGFSKLDVMFGHARPNAVRLPYEKFVKPGVPALLQETISLVDPVAKRVTTDRGTHEADFLVIALGADYDFAATPGMADATEFYTLEGATRLGEILPSFTQGHVLIAVGGAPFKCPPAPSEAALMDARLPHDPRRPQRMRDHAHPPARSSDAPRRPRPHGRCSPRSRSGTSLSSPTVK